MTPKKQAELLQTTLPITNTFGAMYRDVCMQIDDLSTYQGAKTIIVNNRRTSTLATSVYTGSSRAAEAGPAPMDIGAFYY